MSSPQQPLQQSDLIFSSASVPISKTLGEIKKSSLSISNRFRSIEQDARFVSDLASSNELLLNKERGTDRERPLPVIANERCGSWYVAPHIKAGSAYFKSTDGHYGQWSFSLRRLNLHLLKILGDSGGMILVDSTRQGKHLPDAFTRTVPIWCAIVNKLLFPDHPVSANLWMPKELVAPSEHAQVMARLEQFLKNAKTLDLDIESLQLQMRKPVIPFWFSQSNTFHAFPERDDLIADCNSIYMCMASYYQPSGAPLSHDDFEYVQGAGDDAEYWGHGITPSIFWAYEELLLTTSEDELPDAIAKCLENSERSDPKTSLASIKPTSWLIIENMTNLDVSLVPKDSLTIICGPTLPSSLADINHKRLLHLRCGAGKLGSRDLRTQLPRLSIFLESNSDVSSIIVCCSTGTDLSVGVGLVLLCSYCNKDGEFKADGSDNTIDKTLIRQRLSWITSSIPAANPARATLNAVNSFLMGPPT